MKVKVAKEELTDLKSEFTSNMNDILAKLEHVQNKINNLQKMNSFKGKTADTAKQYFQSVHGKTITEIKSTINFLQNNLQDLHTDFTQNVDQSQTAILTEGHINETDKKVLSIKKSTVMTHEKGEQTVREISDLVSVYMPSIASIESSILNSSKYIQTVNEDLHNYDNRALKKVSDSREKVSKLKIKLESYVSKSHSQTSMNELDLMDFGVKGTKEAEVNESSLLYMIAGYKSFKKFNKHINNTNKFMTAGLQLLIHSKLDKKDRAILWRTGEHALKKAQYIQFNNILSSSIYKFNEKKMMEFIRTHKLDVFKKENFKNMLEYVKPYNQNRGKLASKRAFEELFDLTKFREFKKLSFSKKATKLVTTLDDELVRKKFKKTKKTFEYLTK